MREIRFLRYSEIRAVAGNHLQGYGAVFDSMSQDLGGFVESIHPGAFARAIRTRQDVRCLFNHNPSAVLGRSKAGTLRLLEDLRGLEFDCSLPDSQLAHDVRVSVERGDIDGCSFAFTVPPGGDSWSNDGKQRRLKDVDLQDVGPVTFPAYTDTNVSARALWPEGVPPDVQRHLIEGRSAGMYSLQARSSRVPGRIVVPIFQPTSPDLETERCQARIRLAQIQMLGGGGQ